MNETNSLSARQRVTNARLVDRAARRESPLLATALRRYAEAEQISWAQLAAQLGGSEHDLNRASLCYPPRADFFLDDVRAIADGGLDLQRLTALLRQLQILQAFGTNAQSTALLLAAREETDEAANEAPEGNTSKNSGADNNAPESNAREGGSPE